MNTTDRVTAIYDACVLYPAPLRDLLMHVLAAAIIARADLIVTFNLKDFPVSKLEQYSIEAIHPDDFIADLILRYPQAVVTAVDCCRQRLRNPPKSVNEFLEVLLRQGLTRSCSLLRQNI
jgi:hypothetical protein